MLSREEATERLKAYERREQAPTGLGQRWAAARSGALFTELLGWISHRTGDAAQIGERVDALSPAKRRQLFDALVPVQAEAVSHWWEWATRAPYQSGWSRRGFRSPRAGDSVRARMARLASLVRPLLRYPQPVEWHAQWAAYSGIAADAGELLAAEIARGNSEVTRILLDQAAGRDPVGGMDRHVIDGLLSAPDPAGWDAVAGLLRAAGRQEGLRQSILERADLAAPGALRLILQVVQDDGLTRFASAVRAVGVWFGEELEVRQDRQVRDHLAVWGPMLERPPGVPELLELSAPDAFLGLHARALSDARAALDTCGALLRTASGPGYAEHRLAAVRLLGELDLPESAWWLVAALRDPDLRVVAAAVEPLVAGQHALHRVQVPREAVAPVAADLDRYGRNQSLQIGLLGVRQAEVGTRAVADALVTLLHDDLADVLEPAFARASADGRAIRMRWLVREPERHRAVLMEFLGDTSDYLRGRAAEALRPVTRITEAEARDLEALLTRKAGGLRTTVLDFLTRQEPAALAATIARLQSGDGLQQRAATELRGGEEGAPAGPSPRVQAALELLDVRAEARTPSDRPRVVAFATAYPAVAANCQRLVDSVTSLLSEHGSQEVVYGGQPTLLSDVRFLGRPEPGGRIGLEELVDPWWSRLAPTLTLGGLEVLLIEQLSPRTDDTWAHAAATGVLGPLRWPRLWEGSRLPWELIGALAGRELRPDWGVPYLLALEQTAAALEVRRLAGPADAWRARGLDVPAHRWQRPPDSRSLIGAFGGKRTMQLAELGAWEGSWSRLWAALRYVDEPEGARDLHTGPTVTTTEDDHSGTGAGAVVIDQPYRWRPATELVGRAFLAGAATEGDLVDRLLDTGAGPRGQRGEWGRRALKELTSERPPAWSDDSRIRSVVDRTVAALLDVELERGDRETPYTAVALTVQRLIGVDTLLRLLRALSADSLVRATWGHGRGQVLSGLLRRCVPGPDDTEVRCVGALRDAGLGENRLIDLAVFAPQWAGVVENVLGWPGLEDGVWWLHAHSASSAWSVDAELRAEREAAISRRTPLPGEELADGATDVAWFGRLRSELGDARLDRLLAVGKYVSDGTGHKRAELFAQALRGELTDEETQARADKKRHQDSLRALGLIPLPDGEGRSDAVLRRYEFLSGYVKGHPGGSQRKASEARAVEIGLQNLARTAGYTDPQRLVWAMEAHAVRDLAAGPVSATHGDLVVTLSLTEGGQPQIDVRRGERALKAVPAPSRKQPEIAALTSRVAALRTQRSRMRDSLEASCVRGDTFGADEYAELFAHPVLRPMLQELVVVTAEGVTGFATDSGHVVSAEGERLELDGSDVRIAHPLDLLRAGAWPDFQHRLFEARRSQPFKQVFREVYTPTESERGPEHTSRRYAGQQIQPRQASGLFRARGWVADYGTGFVKTYHDAGVTVWCSMLDGFGSPTEVEDATVDTVWFLRGHEVLPLDDVPPRLFSETMRDLDLVVSVAHSGGVDPETSESAVELRRRLVEETCLMLKIFNVTTVDHHAEIRGTLATYSVNLGSGVVHRRPGSSVCIVPVSAQHRGRVFLPFADDDPKTAEVISKVLLLAKDHTIKDPTILAQLR